LGKIRSGRGIVRRERRMRGEGVLSTRTSFESGLSPRRSTMSMMGEATARAVSKVVIAKKRMVNVSLQKLMIQV
jgi:hypothetical protein